MAKSISDVIEKFLFRLMNRLGDNLVGEILTITDVAAQDEVQRKALKDLVQSAIWQTIRGANRELDGLCADLRAKLGEKTTTPPIGEPGRANIFE